MLWKYYEVSFLQSQTYIVYIKVAPKHSNIPLEGSISYYMSSKQIQRSWKVYSRKLSKKPPTGRRNFQRTIETRKRYYGLFVALSSLHYYFSSWSSLNLRTTSILLYYCTCTHWMNILLFSAIKCTLTRRWSNFYAIWYDWRDVNNEIYVFIKK